MNPICAMQLGWFPFRSSQKKGRGRRNGTTMRGPYINNPLWGPFRKTAGSFRYMLGGSTSHLVQLSFLGAFGWFSGRASQFTH